MASYRAPVQFMQFLLHDVFNTEGLMKSLGHLPDFNRELMDAILEESARFNQEIILPTNEPGDKGCQFNNGEVTTPEGTKEAYQQLCEAGWTAMGCPEEFGGQPVPKALHLMTEEMLYACNTAFGLYPNLTHGAINLLKDHGSDDVKANYLPKLVSGQWSGTMCLTEPHAGTDLGLIKTKAEPQADGTYELSGTKIFISAGEHDLTENIIHLVLAKLPDAPSGSKGISLFLVPKFLLDDAGNPDERNGITCGSIEHKMGINGSATCVMNLDNAKGFLVGEVNGGLKCMFTMMNSERISVGIQGVGIAEIALQNAVQYALDRKQGRGTNSENEADMLLVHGDIRRMLLKIMGDTGASRALTVLTGNAYDTAYNHSEREVSRRAHRQLGLLTPVCKAFFTDKAYENCNVAQQIFGGHGYIKEWGMEQFVRDCRITQIYEGTNSVQAFDLLGRKILADSGRAWGEFKQELNDMIKDAATVGGWSKECDRVKQALSGLSGVTDSLISDEDMNPDKVNSLAVDYMHLFGTVTFGCLWLKMAAASVNVDEMTAFHRQLQATAKFYICYELASVSTYVERLMAGQRVMMDPEQDIFEAVIDV